MTALIDGTKLVTYKIILRPPITPHTDSVTSSKVLYVDTKKQIIRPNNGNDTPATTNKGNGIQSNRYNPLFSQAITTEAFPLPEAYCPNLAVLNFGI